MRFPAQRREALLDEFEKIGASGAKFAQLAGIKYATFAGWVLKRRQAGPQGGKDDAEFTSGPGRWGGERRPGALV